MHKAFKCLILTDLSAELPLWIRAQMTLQGESSTYKSYALAKVLWKHKNRPPTPVSLHSHPHTILHSQETGTVKPMWSSYRPPSLQNTGITKASSTLHPENSILCLYILQPLTPRACWLRQIGKLSAVECLLECFLIISGKYGLCIIINWTKHWRSVSQVPVNGAINSQRREVYSIWKLSFSIHLHSSPKVLSSGLLLSITLIRLIPS